MTVQSEGQLKQRQIRERRRWLVVSLTIVVAIVFIANYLDRTLPRNTVLLISLGGAIVYSVVEAIISSRRHRD